MAGVIDLCLAGVLLLSILAGARDGFVDSLFSLVAWFGSCLLGVHLARPVAAHLPEFLRKIPGSTILTGVVIFLVVYAVLRMLGLGRGKGDRAGGDRWLGGLFGLLRGLFLASAVACLLVAFLPPDGRVMRRSRALPMLAPAGKVVAQVAPDFLRERIDRGWARLEGRDRLRIEGIPT